MSQQQQAPIRSEPVHSTSGTESKPHDESKPSFGEKVAGIGARAEATLNHVSKSAEEKFRYQTGNLNAADMLINQHREIQSLLANTMSAKDPSAREKLLHQLCEAVRVYLSLEDDLFYPAIQSSAEDDTLIKRSAEGRGYIRSLMVQLTPMKVTDPLFDQTLQMLATFFVEHVRVEEELVLPGVRQWFGKDKLLKLGEQMHERYNEISHPSKQVSG